MPEIRILGKNFINKNICENLRNQIIEKIDNRSPIEEIITLLEEYSYNKMKIDYDGKVSNEKIQEITDYIIDFINKSMQKGYFNDENIYYNLKQLVIKNFVILPPGEIYGECECYRGSTQNFKLNSSLLNFNARSERLKHTVFHELTHAVTPTLNGKGGIYKNDSRNPNSPQRIFHDFAALFLRECIAESTACDLLDDYRPTKTLISPEGVYSDWVTEWNRKYQELGAIFLDTVPSLFKGNNERETFKSLTLEAMNPDNNIIDDIVLEYLKKHPDTWKEDLHKITSILGELYINHSLDPNHIKEAKQIMRKYLKINIINRNNDTDERED